MGRFFEGFIHPWSSVAGWGQGVVEKFGIHTEGDWNAFVKELERGDSAEVLRVYNDIMSYGKKKKKRQTKLQGHVRKKVKEEDGEPMEWEEDDEKENIALDAPMRQPGPGVVTQTKKPTEEPMTSESSLRCCVDLGKITIKGDHPLKMKVDGYANYNYSWEKGYNWESLSGKARWVFHTEFLVNQTLAANATKFTYNDSTNGDGFNSASLLEQIRAKWVPDVVATSAVLVSKDANSYIDDTTSAAIILDHQFKEFHFKNVSPADAESPAFVEVFVVKLQEDIHAIDTVLDANDGIDAQYCPILSQLKVAFDKKQLVSNAGLPPFRIRTGVAVPPYPAATSPISADMNWNFTMADAQLHPLFKIVGCKKFCLHRGQQGILKVVLPGSQYLTFDHLNRSKFVSLEGATDTFNQQLPVVHCKGSYHVLYRFWGGMTSSYTTVFEDGKASVQPTRLSVGVRHRVVARLTDRSNKDNFYSYAGAGTELAIDGDVDIDYAV